MMATILVAVAHTDDETLGCGGTIARFAAEGYRVIVCALTDGVGARGDRSAEAKNRRWQHAQAAGSVLGVSTVESLGTPIERPNGDLWDGIVPDNEADQFSRLQITQLVERAIERWRPTVILTHYAGDLNIDHRRVAEAVLCAARPQRACPVREILAFEVPSSTEWGLGVFRPTIFVDVAETLEAKLAALAEYVDEVRPFPHPRSPEAVRALAAWRGATVSKVAAEAFEVVRIIR